ncbi:MAG TPA: hypothetical protein V6C52_03635 [Coleofasciculaceae cyanobacterium]
MQAFKAISPPLRVKGLSLIELGVVMVIISLALVPLVQMIGGPNSRNGQGSAQRLNALRSKEMVLANALIERALSSDFAAFNCNNGFNPATGLPATGQTINLPAGNRCTDNTYNDPLYYQWTVRNADNSNAIVPTGNHYYQLVLNVWNQPTGGTPLLTLPTTVFWNESGSSGGSNTTGIVIVQDISGSMTSGKFNGSPVSFSPASPYLNYRYSDPSVGYVPNPAIALPWNDNSQLDLVSALDVNNPQTAWDDRYPKPGVLGVTACTGASPLWNNTGGRMIPVREICQANGGPNGNAWQATMNDHLSRIEAARSSLLSFLLSIEADPDLHENTKLGFITFETNVINRVTPLEASDASNRYPQMRRKLSWINRQGPAAARIYASGSTNMYGGLQRGAQIVFADNTLDNRIIFLVGDGEPTVAPTNHAAFQTLATQIGNGTFPGANGKTASVFTLGLLSGDVGLPIYLRDDIANRTPGGQFFFAQNMGDVSPMFDQIKYQIQRVILLNKSNRYNVDFG